MHKVNNLFTHGWINIFKSFIIKPFINSQVSKHLGSDLTPLVCYISREIFRQRDILDYKSYVTFCKVANLSTLQLR